MMHTRFFMLLLALLVVACRPTQAQTAFSMTVPPSQAQVESANLASPVPTINRQPSRTPTPTVTDTPTLTPTQRPTETPVPTTTSTAIPIHTPTLDGTAHDPAGSPTPTWTPPADDPATRIEDHYHMRRPIPEGNTNYVARSYPYGSTQGGNLQTHLGVDIENPRGIPVIAAADGTVVYAGDDLTTQFGPITNYYGRLVVLEHAFRTADGQPVFSLYGHLSRWDVEAGATVNQGDQIGLVGDAGVAQGPHLHFEVRVGDPYDFHNTRNPELWIYPFQTFGTLAGIVTDASGTRLYDAPIQVRSVDLSRYAFTYHDDVVNPDDVFNENFVLGDLPANYYEVSVTSDGRVRFRRVIYIYPNRTTWIDIQLN